jgi:hypothetical protein
MKFPVATLALIAVALSSTASAKIYLGTTFYDGQDNGGENIAWIDGEDACGTNVLINKVGDNPCNIPFTLDNGYTYTEQWCGTDQYQLQNSDGSFNSYCYATGVTGFGEPCFDAFGQRTWVKSLYICG